VSSGAGNAESGLRSIDVENPPARTGLGASVPAFASPFDGGDQGVLAILMRFGNGGVILGFFSFDDVGHRDSPALGEFSTKSPRGLVYDGALAALAFERTDLLAGTRIEDRGSDNMALPQRVHFGG
jgi:hypothetical protein